MAPVLLQVAVAAGAHRARVVVALDAVLADRDLGLRVLGHAFFLPHADGDDYANLACRNAGRLVYSLRLFCGHPIAILCSAYPLASIGQIPTTVSPSRA